jgi:hypothetical protein
VHIHTICTLQCKYNHLHTCGPDQGPVGDGGPVLEDDPVLLHLLHDPLAQLHAAFYQLLRRVLLKSRNEGMGASKEKIKKKDNLRSCTLLDQLLGRVLCYVGKRAKKRVGM